MRTNTPSHKRILLVSPSPHFPPENGGNQRTYLLWKALSDIAPVDVILCDDISFDSSVTAASIPASLNFLGRFPWRSKGHSLYRLFTKSTPNLTVERLMRVVLPRDWDYDVDRRLNQSLSDVLGSDRYFLAVGRYLKPIVKTGLVGRMPCLLDIDDVDFDIFAQRAQDVTRPRWQRLLYSAQASQIKAAFKKWLPHFQGLWVVKADDTRYEVTRNAALLPNIPYNVPVSPPLLNGSRSANPIILTVGAFYYLPNRDGVDRFIRVGWPKVRAACPTAEYWLAGKNDLATARRWKQSLASRSWDLLTISLRFTARVGLQCARSALERVRTSKSWKAWLSDGHVSRRSSVIEDSKIACRQVVLCLWQQIQKMWRRIVSD